MFLGFATLKNTYGVIILTEKHRLIVARHNVSFDEQCMPYHEKKTTSRNEYIRWLLGQHPNTPRVQDVLPDSTPQQPTTREGSTDEEDPSSSDDDEPDPAVTRVLDDLHNTPAFKAPSYNDLSAEIPSEAPRVPLDLPQIADNFVRPQKRSTFSREVPTHAQADLGKRRRLQPSRYKPSEGNADADSASKSAKKKVTLEPDAIRKDKTLLFGKTISRQSTGVCGKITDFDVANNAYKVTYSVDGHEELIPFDDVLALLPATSPSDCVHASVNALEESLRAAVHLAQSLPDPTVEIQTPTGCHDAQTKPEWPWWKPEFDGEYHNLGEKMKCWEIVDTADLPEGANLIDCKWVCKVKYRQGQLERLRARIVALGYQQRKGIDYFESFSPTASHTSIRLLLALTALPGFKSIDWDVTCAFISAVLKEPVYMRSVPGYELPPGKCYRLRKTIYGLVQSPRCYYLLVKDVYTKCGLRQLESDECVFVVMRQNVKGQPELTAEGLCDAQVFEQLDHVPKEKRIYPSCPHSVAFLAIAVYVDNNGGRYNCDELVTEFEEKVKADGRIQLNREGTMDWFLSVRYTHDVNTGEVRADQEHFIEKIASKHDLPVNGEKGVNAPKLPIKPSVDLAAIPIPDREDPLVTKAYQSICGEMLYVAINTMPIIIFVISALARYMSKPSKEHYQYAKGCLRFIVGNRKRQIIYNAGKVKPPHLAGQLYSYSDSSWADVIPRRKSTYCFLVFVNNAVFSWKSALSTILATSSGVAELLAVCAAGQEIAWARKFAAELGFLQLAPTPLYIDSTAAKKIAEQGCFKGKTKAVDYRFHFVCDLIDRGIVQLQKIPRAQQLADIGTAARAAPQFLPTAQVWYGET